MKITSVRIVLIILLLGTISFCLYSKIYFRQTEINNQKLLEIKYKKPNDPYLDIQYVEAWENNVKNYCSKNNDSKKNQIISKDEYQIYSAALNY